MERDKILIIGAGVGGLTAARRIAETGRSVIVVDQKVDPEEPLPKAIRHAAPWVDETTAHQLGLSTGAFPLITEQKIGVMLGLTLPVPRLARAYGIDILSARRDLLKKASRMAEIELVQGKVVDLRTQTVKGEKRATGVLLRDGREIETGEEGLVVMAAGIGTTIFSDELIDKRLRRRPKRVLGAHITSPALKEQPRTIMRIGMPHLQTGVIVPMEQIEKDGTDFAAIFAVTKRQLNKARGGSEKVLAAMQRITWRTRWAKFFDDAIVDRLLYYDHTHDVRRRPLVGGLVLVGDASADLRPGVGSGGLARINMDTYLLAKSISGTERLDQAVALYNKAKRYQ